MNGRLIEKTPRWLPIGAFLIAASLLLPFYRYELSPDAISYLSIAKQYLAGYWAEALNAYWGPLYSWCIVGLLALRIPDLLAAKLVDVCAGVVTLLALRRVAPCLGLKERLVLPVLWIAAAMVLAFAMEIDSPDLLFTAVLLLYLGIILNPAYPVSHFAGAQCGLLGGLAYLTKSYGFFFFVTHFVAFSALYWWNENSRARRRLISVHIMAGLTVFCAISLAWVVPLQGKYGRWLLATTGDFNHRLVGPASAGYPHFRHLIPPTSEHAITAWQDPSPSWLPGWDTFGGSFNVKHESKLVYGNAKNTFKFWMYTTPLFIVLLPAYIVLCLRYSIRRFEWVYPLLTLVLFSVGYLLITVQDRYLWLPDLLLLGMAFRALQLLFTKSNLSSKARILLSSAVAVSFLLYPADVLRAHFATDRQLYRSTSALKQTALLKGRLASCGNWRDSAYLAYVLNLPYYGVPAPVPDADESARALNPDYVIPASSDVNRASITGALSADRISYLILWPKCGQEWAHTGTIVSIGKVRFVKLNAASRDDRHE